MSPVYYLCQSPDNAKRLVFASELPENYYSPGLFVIEAANRAGSLERIFSFRARQGQQELSLELRRAPTGRAYVVNVAQIGTFYFKVLALERNVRYAGRRPREFHDMPLYRVEPANMNLLERACLDFDFYFIGSSGPDADEMPDSKKDRGA